MKKVFLFAVLATLMVGCGAKSGQQTEEVQVGDSLAVPTEEVLEGGAGVSTSEEVAEPVSEQPVK